jgi:hypothetical protein
MTTNSTLDQRETKHKLSEYTTAELVSVLAHAENSRRQLDRFLESITAELARRGEPDERVANPALRGHFGVTRMPSPFLRRRKQSGSALAHARSKWMV